MAKSSVVLILPVMVAMGLVSCESFSERQSRPSDFDESYARSRGEMGAELAAQARDAFEQGNLNQALRLAEMAGHFDDSQGPLLTEIRSAMSVHLADDADRLLAVDNFSAARARAQQAMDAHPEDARAQQLLQQINQREADAYVQLAREHQAAEELPAALLALERAERIDEDNAAARFLRSDLVATDRAERIARLTTNLEQHIADRRLAAATGALEGLKAADADAGTIQSFTDQLSQLQSNAESLRERGMQAFDASDFESAITQLTQAQQANTDFQLRPYISEAQIGMERKTFLAAMESGNRLEALQSARRLESLQTNERMRELLPQLEDAVVLETLRESNRLIEDNDIDQAKRVLQNALNEVDDVRLRDAMNDLN